MAMLNVLSFLLSYFPKYVCRAQFGCSSSSLMSCFLGMLFEYCLNHFDMDPLAPVIAAITFAFLFHMYLIFFKLLIYKHLYYCQFSFLACCVLYFVLTVIWPGFILKILFFLPIFCFISFDFCFCGIFLCLFSLFVSDACILVPSWMVLSKYLEKCLISQIFL